MTQYFGSAMECQAAMVVKWPSVPERSVGLDRPTILLISLSFFFAACIFLIAASWGSVTFHRHPFLDPRRFFPLRRAPA